MNSEKLRAVLLDDEERACTLLQKKLMSFEPNLEVIAILNNPVIAVEAIQHLEFDVLFLDVEMPLLNGFQFLERLGAFDFEVVFVTAYNSYTLNALRINALDYLLKPVDEEELQAAVERLVKRTFERIKLKTKPAEPISSHNRIALPTAEGIYLVRKAEIIRVEAMSNYSIFYLSDSRKIIVSRTLKEYENVLVDNFFMRINRSAIINLEFVLKYKKGDGGTISLSDGHEIEVSPSKKDLLLKKLFEDQ
ncbi:LytR/AlgR family response regulator transcription factor [Pedobacter lithocola]|uniref:LytR/AlgR family response regulator transcription factor n=1 Tax=Pedobacter lithocola TaxID=1908239 RepID=A0ABV8PCG6_9SPHI